jgi:HAMP domain-containing protein
LHQSISQKGASGSRGAFVGAMLPAMLFDSKGVAVVYPDLDVIKAARPLTDLPPVADALAGKRGPTTFYNPGTQRDELGTIVPLKTNGWFVVVSRSKDAAFAELNSLRTSLTLLLAAGIALVVGLGFWVARTISRNVRTVAVAAAALAEGDVAQNISVNRRDEVGRMAAGFQETVAYLREMATAGARPISHAPGSPRGSGGPADPPPCRSHARAPRPTGRGASAAAGMWAGDGRWLAGRATRDEADRTPGDEAHWASGGEADRTARSLKRCVHDRSPSVSAVQAALLKSALLAARAAGFGVPRRIIIMTPGALARLPPERRFGSCGRNSRRTPVRARTRSAPS